MPTLPEEEEDSPEELDSSSSSPVSYTPAESHVVNTVLPTPSIVIPGQANTDNQVPKPLKQTRSQSPRPRLSRNSSGNAITSIDSAGHVIDLVKDTLPEVQLSEEDKKKNLELLEEAKKVSDRFLTRRGRRSTCSLSDSPTGLSPSPTPRSSPVPSRSSSLTVPPQFGTFSHPIHYAMCISYMNTEHKLIRNQSIVGSKLPDLSETAEQDRGNFLEEECKEKLDVMPSISDVMLRKLKLHRALPGNAPSLTEKEVENAFVQLSLAFRNDSYTLEMRLRHAERDRNLTEENNQQMPCPGSVMLWQNLEQRETYQRLLETVDVLHRLATRLSSRAEMVGAVRQEKRMNKATEVMMQYVENLKRTYEKDHAELMEFKKLANQNSSRCYGGSMDNGGTSHVLLLGPPSVYCGPYSTSSPLLHANTGS
uniref:Inositol 1,4,5-triphosphate receptor associated 1 n=1 Tax=Scleropages formosus TaxID=113540 RepID=A0A8C9VB79_SCLFO